MNGDNKIHHFQSDALEPLGKYQLLNKIIIFYAGAILLMNLTFVEG